MRVINKTSLPTKFLARLTRWVRDEVNPARDVGQVTFRKGRVMKATRDVVADVFKVVPTFVYALDCRVGPTVLNPPNNFDETEQFYPLVIHLAAAMKPSLVPPGDLGMIRMAIGQTWVTLGAGLVEKWMQGCELPPCPKVSAKQNKLNTAQKAVEKWQRKAKLAQTKLKIWNRRLKAAQRALEGAKVP